jgi:integrase
MNSPRPTIGAARSHDGRHRDWFLRNSSWTDAVWIFEPTSRLDEDHPQRIRWDFTLSDGYRFTDPPHADLLESSRQHLSSIRLHSLRSGPGRHASTVRALFHCLRALIRWMTEQGFHCFADLDKTAIRDFTLVVASRPGRRAGSTIGRSTLEQYLHVLVYLFQHRGTIEDSLKSDPFPGERAGSIAQTHTHRKRCGPYTPDLVAVPLIQGAIDFLTTSAVGILRARETYISAMTTARRRTARASSLADMAIASLRPTPIATPRGPCMIESMTQFAELIEYLYTACFIVIAYLLGARVSEILHLQSDCVRPLQGDAAQEATALALIAGTIYKAEAYHGRPHEWIAPPPAVHAIFVLEALSAPHRQRTHRQELWLRPRSHFRGAAEWQKEHDDELHIPTTFRINKHLNRFAAWIDIPLLEGKPWGLSSHQGRKTFARFVALRDRTSLFALAQHLGHRERSITDAGYSGTDYALEREIDEHVLDQSVSAWEHMLSVPHLGGRAGQEILAKRPHFRGVTMKEDIKGYARMLSEAGLTLGVCDWGYCVYREENSACLGNPYGPDPVRREPSTCARCKNFAVSSHHRAYWQDQMRRYEALLNEPALPAQTLKIARMRFEEARAIVRSIESAEKDNRHG